VSRADRNPLLLKLEYAWRRVMRDEAMRSRVEFLKKIFLFEGLSTRAVALIAGKMMEKAYAPGEPVFQEGDVGRACFIVAEGRVEIHKQDPAAGQGKPLAALEPGDFFGEMTLIDELPRSATARAASPARLYILYKTHLDDLGDVFPRVAARLLRNLARLLSARLRQQNLQSAVDSTLKTSAR
jgi:CRP/FNR family transcriptional regulator, cyclic AMP receptor protein